jgi:D-alanyl-D-alanine carboxypeptidase
MKLKLPSAEFKPLFWTATACIAILALWGIYTGIRLSMLSSKIETLTTDAEVLTAKLASTTVELRVAIDNTHASLSSALTDEQKNVSRIKEQLGGFEEQVDDFTDSLDTLEKLAQTDPELLKKYSKVYFLNENYVPARLSEIPNKYQYSDTKQLLIHTDILEHLTDMIDQASSTGVKLYVFSAYRSFAEQRALKGGYTVNYGAGTANSFSADQGYSEHQLGTTVDMITPGLGGVLDGFDNTVAYEWMKKNAYKFGFVLSYPEKNSYYVYEPWHWRYVGVKLARQLNKDGKNFYDLEQREIDEYLVSVFD